MNERIGHPSDAMHCRAIASRLRPWPEGAPDPRFVPPAGTRVLWEGMVHVIETGVPVRQNVDSGAWCAAAVNTHGYRCFIPLDEIERIPATRTIRVGGIPADLPDHQIIVARQTTARVQGEYRTEPIPGARIIGGGRPMDDRLDWIRRRTEAGYEWGGLVLALSQLVVHHVGDGDLEIDASALPNSESRHSRYTLYPGPNGHWLHEGSGEAGPLVEMLLVIAMTHLSAWDDTTQEQTDG